MKNADLKLSDASLTIKDAQDHMDVLYKRLGWDKTSNPETFLLLVEEVGELAKEIRKHDKVMIEKDKIYEIDLESEFADVLGYIIDLANRYNVDLEKAYKEKTNINLSREWN